MRAILLQRKLCATLMEGSRWWLSIETGRPSRSKRARPVRRRHEVRYLPNNRTTKWAPPRRKLISLHAGQRFRNLADIGHDGDVVVLVPGKFSLAVDD